MLGRTDSRGRLFVLLIGFVIASGALLARLSWWQVVRQGDLAAAAYRQVYLRIEQPSPRGEIYDRSGVVVLAGSVTRDRLVVGADRMSAEQRDRMVAFLTEMLQLDEAGAQAVRTKLETGKPYLVLAQDLSPETSEAIRAAAGERGIGGIGFESQTVRTYPQAGGSPGSSLAAALLGFVNREGKGQYGVEQYYQDVLTGKPRIVEADKDANGEPVIDTERTIQSGAPGSDVRLTIDAGLQLAIEQEVMTAAVADRAKSASAVVMDPYTGEVYAMADYPSFDANSYAAVAGSDPGRFVNTVVSNVYEPGSVFKMMTVIAGLEAGTVSMDTKFVDTGSLKLDGGKAVIHDADRQGMGEMRFEDAIAWSRNVVAAKAALGLSPSLDQASAKLHEVWTRMGFGSPTGIDLAGEVGGLVNDPAISKWQQVDLANGSFGQGVAVTQIQLASAYAAMMNGGTLVTPHVVASVAGHDLKVEPHGKVLDPALTPQLLELMNHVVTTVPTYSKGTLIPGYWVGGKTGTAQIWDAKAKAWKSGIFDFSFVGYIGRRVGHPDLVVAVRITEGRPTAHRAGGLYLPVMSFELFRRIATDAIKTPGLLPELPIEEAPVAKVGA
jgi:cell division protein FtsI/penicillin-binding protein 2